jgi:two-component system, OmpR family, response regulator CpxR
MERMSRVLIIDDDQELTEMLEEYLGPEGFTVDGAHNGEDGLKQALAGDYALIVLDIMMPKMNGVEVLRRLRSQSRVPVIMLTARGQEMDRIIGLEIGCDDYLTKPFNARELLARMNAVLRRTQSTAEPADDSISVGDVVLDARARTVRRNGRLIDLTSAEFDVLKILLATAGQLVPREDLFQKVLGRDYSALDRSIDNHISSLRKKLGAKIDGTDRIKSVRGSGYVYAYTSREKDRT